VPLLFDVLLHVATLFVILVYFRGAIKNVFSALWKRDFHSQDGKLILPIIIGTIPTALIALLVGNELDSYFNSLALLGAGLIAGGIILVTSKFTTEKKDTISYPVAFLIGVMQGISIIPSISRSGLTIAVALLLGIKRDVAFKFSFLLSVPAIIGALGLTLIQEHNALSIAGIGTLEIVASVAITVAVSFLALKVLWKSIAAKKFYLFSIYSLIMGATLVVLGLLGF
jgi:undecaprenyl-diphosphatase